MHRIVFLAALLVLGCAAGDPPCDRAALGIEGVLREEGGVMIAEVLPRGPADLAGLRRGDVLVSVGGREIRYACEVSFVVFNRSCAPVSIVVKRDGTEIEKNITPAEQQELYRAACEANDPTACFRAAWLEGESYEKACELGSAEACAAHGHALMEARNADAVPVLERACDRGSGAGCTHLAYLYTTGSLVTKNDIRALDFYTRGCSYGDARGCYNMGVLHDDGRGTSVSNARAASAYERGCAAGVSRACTDLGYLLERGLGTMKDTKRAAEMYQRGCDGSSCEASNLRGCVNLGNVYRDGIGVEKDPARAAQIFRTACERTSAKDEEKTRIRACVLLGALEMNGLGVPQNMESGLARSNDGCTRGDSLGCFNVAAMYAWREDFIRAAELYEKSCEKGDAESCYELGVLYDDAKGVPYDPTRSRALFKRACDGGFAEACNR